MHVLWAWPYTSLDPFPSPSTRGNDDPAEVDLVWIGYKNAEVARVSGCTVVQYRVEAVQLSDAGQYSCNAKFNNGSSINPVLPGNITVLGGCHGNHCMVMILPLKWCMLVGRRILHVINLV